LAGDAVRLAALVVLLVGCNAPVDRDRVVVFSAAGVGDAMEEIARDFSHGDASRVALSLAASSTLVRQIESGAPANVYVSASDEWMDWAVEHGLVLPGTRTRIAGNRLVLVAPDGSDVSLGIRPGMDLAAALEGGRLATGDPDHVPVGRYARAALVSLGAWEGVEHRIAPASTTRSALAMVEHAEAPLGIVYATDALSSERVRVVGTFPAWTHPPIVFSAAIVEGRNTDGARRFLAFLTGERARSVLAARGYEVEG
jgi:molybdate transport system substrate-binding protein